MYFRMLHDAASGAMSCLLADLAAGKAVLIDARVIAASSENTAVHEALETARSAVLREVDRLASA